MKTFKLNNITLNEEQMKEISMAYNKLEFVYPLFKRSMFGAVFKYTSLKEFEIVMVGSSTGWRIGETHKNNSCKYAHTAKDIRDITYNRKRNLWHGQPVLHWNNSETHSKTFGFYNAKLDCVFPKSVGGFKASRFDNYQAIQPSDYKAWHIESYATLEIED